MKRIEMVVDALKGLNERVCKLEGVNGSQTPDAVEELGIGSRSMTNYKPSIESMSRLEKEGRTE